MARNNFLRQVFFNPRINRPFGSIWGLAAKAQILLVDSWVYHRFDVTSPSRFVQGFCCSNYHPGHKIVAAGRRLMSLKLKSWSEYIWIDIHVLGSKNVFFRQLESIHGLNKHCRLGICGTKTRPTAQKPLRHAQDEKVFFLMGEYHIIIISNDVDIYNIYIYIKCNVI